MGNLLYASNIFYSRGLLAICPYLINCIGWVEFANKWYRGWDISTQFISRKSTVVVLVVITLINVCVIDGIHLTWLSRVTVIRHFEPMIITKNCLSFLKSQKLPQPGLSKIQFINYCSENRCMTTDCRERVLPCLARAPSCVHHLSMSRRKRMFAFCPIATHIVHDGAAIIAVLKKRITNVHQYPGQTVQALCFYPRSSNIVGWGWNTSNTFKSVSISSFGYVVVGITKSLRVKRPYNLIQLWA